MPECWVPANTVRHGCLREANTCNSPVSPQRYPFTAGQTEQSWLPPPGETPQEKDVRRFQKCNPRDGGSVLVIDEPTGLGGTLYSRMQV